MLGLLSEELSKLIQASTAERYLRSRLQRTEQRMRQDHSSKAQDYRRKAKSCDGFVAHALSTGDRDRLLRIRDSYLTLAVNEEWLGGLPPTPPARASALMTAPH